MQGEQSQAPIRLACPCMHASTHTRTQRYFTLFRWRVLWVLWVQLGRGKHLELCEHDIVLLSSAPTYPGTSYRRFTLLVELRQCSALSLHGDAVFHDIIICSFACRPSWLSSERSRARPTPSRVGASGASTWSCPVSCLCAALDAPSHQHSSHTFWC